MTYAAVSAIQPNSGSPVPSLSLITHTIGNFVLAEVLNTGTATATALASTHCTWTALGTPYTGVSATGTCQCFLGVVTSAATANVTVTWGAGTTNVFSNLVAQEFSTTTGTPVLDTQGHVDTSAGTATWASLTPAASGEAYFGSAINKGSATNGSTSGYTYGDDGSGNGVAQNAACGAGAQAPVWGDSGQSLGIMVLVKPAGGTTDATAAAALYAATAVFPAPTVSGNVLSSGPNYAGAGADLGGGSGSWTSPGNAAGTDDDTYASWTVP